MSWLVDPFLVDDCVDYPPNIGGLLKDSPSLIDAAGSPSSIQPSMECEPFRIEISALVMLMGAPS